MIQKILKKLKYELQFNNPHYYTRVSDKLLKSKYQRSLSNKISLLKPIVLDGEKSKLTVAILANKKNFHESLAALYSFCFWENRVQVHYHEDGSLNDDDIAIIRKIFKGITVYKRAEQDLKVTNYLSAKGLTNCAELRQHFVFSIRLFDMLIEKQTPYLLQIDSDVLFFTKPLEVLEIIEQGNLNGCYNQDVGNVYSFKPDIIAKYLDVPVLNNVNAGLFMHNFDEELFQFTEHIIKNEPECRSSWHLEQSVFALYASLKGDFLALPKQYDLQRRERKLGNKLISEHYCHSTGYDFHKDFIYKLYPQYAR